MEFTITCKALVTVVMPVFDLATKDVYKDCDYYGKITLVANKKYLGAVSSGFMKFNSYPYPASISNSISTGYTCIENGYVTVDATELMNSLNSFRPQQELYLRVSEGELLISPEDNNQEFQSLPMSKDKIVELDISKSCKNSFKLTRKVLTLGMKQVKYALGEETNKMIFQYICLDNSNGVIRFTAGNGGRFAVYDVTDK